MDGKRLAMSAGQGVRECLAPPVDRRQAFEEEYKERIYQSSKLKPLGRPVQRGQGPPPAVDPGFAFGVPTHGDGTTSVKTLLCSSTAATATAADDETPRPLRRSQGLRIPPTYVFGRGNQGQYKGGASDGVASALAYVDGGAASDSYKHQHQAQYDQTRVYGLRSRRDEDGTMKACLQHGATATDEQHDERREPDRQLAPCTAGYGAARGRTRGATAEVTTAALLAPDAVGLAADDEYFEPRSKDDLRRIFLQRLGPQCGLDSEEAFERVFARAVQANNGHETGTRQDRCSIQAFCAAL